MFRVVKDFISKDDLKQYKAGEDFACLDIERAEKLLTKGYIVERIEDVPPEEPEPEPEEKPQEEPEKKAKAKASKGKKEKKA